MEILLGPQAFEDFILFIISTISVGVQGFRNMLLLLGKPKYEEKLLLDLGILTSMEDPMLTKKSFKDSAISMFETFSLFL